MDDRRERMQAYKRARRKFACIVYLITLVWLLLALAQWVAIVMVDDARWTFYFRYYISIACFVVGIVLVTIFIFFEQLRFVTVLNWVISIVIVELIIIGVFALVARTSWKDLLIWFGICALLIFLFILIGSILPHDLTLDVVILFVLAFIFLIITVFFIMLYIVVGKNYNFIVYQVFITLTVLLFVMYHAQTINGGRFAEMRVNDYLLASLILFHDFVIIFMLTFHAQVTYRFDRSYYDYTFTFYGSDFTLAYHDEDLISAAEHTTYFAADFEITDSADSGDSV